LNFENKRQKREYYHQVSHVAVEGQIMQTKWSHMPLTFTEVDTKLVSFPHIDAMVTTTHIDKWNVTRVLVDNGSQTKILFFSPFDQMCFNRKQLKEETKQKKRFVRTIMISQDLSQKDETELLSFLDKNIDVFTWQTSDLTGVRRSIIEHRLEVNPSAKPKWQKLHKMSDEKVIVAKSEV
jgi:hypothetical protein